MSRRSSLRVVGRSLAGGLALVGLLLALACPVSAAVGPAGSRAGVAPAGVGTCSPGATLSASPTMGAVPVIVNFLVSVPPAATTPTYAWSFGDGADWNGSGGGYSAPSHLYTRSGSFNASVGVRNGGNLYDCWIEIELGAAGPSVSASASPTIGEAPLTVQFVGSASGGSGTYVEIRWSFGDGSNFSGLETNHTFENPGTYTVQLKVVDSNGSAAFATIEIQVGGPGLAPWVYVGIEVLLIGLVVGLISSVFRFARFRRALTSVRPAGPEAGAAPVARADSTPNVVSSAATTGTSQPVPSPAELPAVAIPPSPELLRVSQRIVRHLAAQGVLRPDEIATAAFTQEGIQAAVGVSRSSVSNALRRLERAEVLQSDVRHVHGGRRRLRVYSLTDRGRALAADLRSGRR